MQEQVKAPYYLYFIQSGPDGAIKIGVTNDMKPRMKLLQNGNPIRLSVVMKIPFQSRDEAFAAEQYWHNLFASKRVLNEWFDITAADVFGSFVATGERFVADQDARDEIIWE